MPKQSLPDLTAEQQRRIDQAFREAVYLLRDRAQVQRIIEALARRDIEALARRDIETAIRGVALDPVAFRGFEVALEQAFEAGGNWQIDRLLARTLPTGPRVDVLFNIRHFTAENWLRNHSSTLVREIIEDQRVAARNFLTAGMEAGANPKTTALDLVGRLNRATGQREGGVLGLTSSQEAWIRNYEADLRDPERLSRALQRSLRDRRFDKTIAKAIRDGTGLDESTIRRMLISYRNKALKLRGDTIGRTEAMASVQRGAYEGIRQAISAGQIESDLVVSVWQTARDSRVRDSHAAMDGEEVPFGQAFSNGLLFPGDPSGPAEEVINCRCTVFHRINYIQQAARDARAAQAFAVG